MQVLQSHSQQFMRHLSFGLLGHHGTPWDTVGHQRTLWGTLDHDGRGAKVIQKT